MKTVLVIDDDTTFASMIGASLDKNAYRIVSAADGVKGLEAMSSAAPDVILLDIKMPNMNGLQFLAEVKKTLGDKKPAIIITSNDSSLETISEGTEFGVRGYILKSNETLHNIADLVEKIALETQ